MFLRGMVLIANFPVEAKFVMSYILLATELVVDVVVLHSVLVFSLRIELYAV